MREPWRYRIDQKRCRHLWYRSALAGRSVSSDSRVTESFNSGKISSNTEATGGVVGYVNASGATVSECYNTGEITVKGRNGNKNISESYAGGVIGTVGAVGVVVEELL